ncbi:MAG: RagB/SusD family nutrient uptake outer membrane protein [Saprospiraceae bacterium]|nr:RagB/SusD family nutrient uptake outer membrane protein [Saprospiraceae bacterium]MCB9319746.1 RagB/SusD family nutrient uptake outer membrane protein [Lewinellaceae bacterium]
MKSIYQCLILAGILLMIPLQGCQGLLEKKPLGELTSDNFFQNETHALWATNAVYNLLRNWEVHVFSYIGMTDIVSDDADKGSTPNDANFLLEIDDFTYDAGNLAMSTVWSGYFRGIYRANLAIENIPNIDMNENLKARYIAENKFLRAYFYFTLVQWFGDLPLILKPLSPDEYKQPRVPAADIYAAIIQDLQDAAGVLPDSYPATETGRATRGAANAYLAKVYLTIGDFAKAEEYAMKVINSGVYGLYPDYAKLFLPEGENSIESVFEVQSTALDIGGAGSQYNEVQGVRGVPNLGWGFNRPSDDLIAEFERGDPRRDATILYVGEVLPDGSAYVQDNPEIVGERYNQKAWVPEHTGGNGNGPGNIRLFRYAEVLLIAAEALNENGNTAQALTYLNMVRARARGGKAVLPDVTLTDKTALRNAIWHERRVELGMEQHRWFDLLRQGRVDQVMAKLKPKFTAGKNELFPIPQSEIDLSGGQMTQNPGY